MTLIHKTNIFLFKSQLGLAAKSVLLHVGIFHLLFDVPEDKSYKEKLASKKVTFEILQQKTAPFDVAGDNFLFEKANFPLYSTFSF